MNLDHVSSLFRARFGSDPQVVSVAPGRINLIGEHTDYNDGFVFPVAIDRQTWLAASQFDGLTNLESAERGVANPFDSNAIQPGQIEGWATYPAGMAWALQSKKRLSNLKGYVTSNLPMGSGVSSSAALEMAFGVVWNELDSLGLENNEIAQFGKKCENGFVGVQSGIMDQMASAMGKSGMAMFLDTRSLEIEYAPIPAHLAIVLLDTKKSRGLVGSHYNERRQQCESAAAAIGVSKLRDATLADLNRAKPKMSEVVYRRGLHIITENSRCIQFKEALKVEDLKTVGALMQEGHLSLRDDFEISCRELDLMVESAWDAPGCVAARMTGGGFGGACVALVDKNLLQEFQTYVLPRYQTNSGLQGEAIACEVVQGAHLEKLVLPL